jgi:hypothetical protein
VIATASDDFDAHICFLVWNYLTRFLEKCQLLFSTFFKAAIAFSISALA